MMAFFNYSSTLVRLSRFPFHLLLCQFVILFKAMLLVSPVNLNILLVIFGVALVLLNDQFSSGVTSIFSCSFTSIKNAGKINE